MLALLLFVAACTPTVCPGLEGEEYSLCVIEEANATGNAQLCTDLPVGGFQEWCITDVSASTGSEEACLLIEERLPREYCLRDRILEAGSVERCSELTAADTQDSCLDKFATQLNSWEPCTEMRRSGSKDECLDRMARKLTDPYGCVDMSLEFEGRDPCLFSLSIATLTIETCDEITDPEGLRYCYINIAARVNDTSLCDKLSGENQQFCTTFLEQLEE
jgi:hypothetical protein